MATSIQGAGTTDGMRAIGRGRPMRGLVGSGPTTRVVNSLMAIGEAIVAEWNIGTTGIAITIAITTGTTMITTGTMTATTTKDDAHADSRHCGSL